MRTYLLVAVVALALALTTACGRDPSRPPLVAADGAGRLLHQRIWLDHEPSGAGDPFHVLVFDDRRTGVHQDRTVWKGAFELFRYQVEGGRLVLTLPGTKRVVKTGFRVERVRRGDADVRLTLDQAPDGPTVYWGYKYDGHDADAWVQATFATR